MRTLNEITNAVRLAEAVTFEELRYAVVAYDVLLSHLKLEEDVARLQSYMIAASVDPKEFIGRDNDPALEPAVAWYRTFIGIDVPPAPRVCSNCDSLLPEGCSGLFKEDASCQWAGKNEL